MKVVCIYDKSGPKYHRILLPCYLMPGIEITVNYRVLEDQVKDCDILFINRMSHNNPLNDIIEWRNKYGFKLVVDFDDHWILSPDHYLYDMYRFYQISELMEAYIEEADLVTVTHERLYNEVVKINDKCEILPNAIPDFGQFQVQKTISTFTRLFWAGGVTHKKDIQILTNPVKRFNFNTMMVMGGYSENNPEYKAMASAFTNGGKLKHNLIRSLPVDEYYRVYSECDISLIPLTNSTFNGYKSNLKILEAANVSAPCVVSRVNPYLDFPEDLVNYVDSQSDWYDHVKMLVGNPDYAKEQGEKLKEYCNIHYNFDKINEKRKQIFEYVTGKQAKIRKIQAEVQ